MNVLLAALVGFLAGRMLWLAMKGSWATSTLVRKNYRGVDVPTAAGLVLCFALLSVEGLRAIFGALGMGEGSGFSPMRAAALVVVLGFALLGLFDDLTGGDDARGLRGHLQALAKGQMTSGIIKMIGGIAVGFVGASFLGAESLGGLLLDAAVIALAANIGNLFDRRPGRAIKVGLLGFLIPAVLLGLPGEMLAPAIVVGAAAAILLDDLHERLMIGDTGANALGAAVGLGIVGATGTSGTGIALVLLIILTLVGEFLSFTKLFESIGPLRAFDQLGTKRAARQGSNKSQPEGPSAAGGAVPPAAPESAPVTEPTQDRSQVDNVETAAAPSFGDSVNHQAEWPELLRDDVPGADTQIDDLDGSEVSDSADDNYGYVAEDEIIDLRDSESESEPNRATLDTGHVGATSGARIRREPRTNYSATRGQDSWTTGRSYGRSAEHNDEFDDLPDFSPRSRTTPRASQDRYRSPFDDKDV